MDWDDSWVGHRHVDVGGVRLHCVEMPPTAKGAAEGRPLVVLLHGFPEFWYSWRHQIPALAHAGYQVVAPDMRGYNLSDKPKGVSSYTSDKLADDIAGLVRAYGASRAYVVGHDWGAMVAWVFAMRHPELLDRLAILNVPHPVRFMKSLRTLRQLKKSWYVFFFQLPWLPERSFTRYQYGALRSMLRKDPVRPGAFTPEDVARYVQALSQPGALTAAINYYRAVFRRGPVYASNILRRIDQPVLVIWGEKDRYLGAELAEPSPKWVPHVRVERLPDASHWVQVDQPERVNELLLEFFQSSSSPPPTSEHV